MGARQPLASGCRPVGDPIAHSELGERDKSLHKEAPCLFEARIRSVSEGGIVPPPRPPCHAAYSERM